jgi:branched-chain amino acid transport system permease protein
VSLWGLLAAGLLVCTLGPGFARNPAGAQTSPPTSAPSTSAPLGTSTTVPSPSGPAVAGRLVDENREPVEGVVFTVSLDGEGVGEATSDSNGQWRVEVPEPDTTYSVTIDTDTLPEGVGLRDPDRDTLDDVRVRTGPKVVLFPLGEPAPGGPAAWESILDLTVEGIRFGLVLAVASLGLSLVFAVTGLTNFAHGELVTFGALVAFFLSAAALELPLPIATVLAVVAGGLLGSANELVLFRPLRKRRSGNISLIVVTIGLGLFLRNLYLVLFEGRPRPFDEYTIQKNIDLGPISLRPKDLWIMALCVVVLVGVALILQKTRLGMSLRAVADLKDLAEASGIDVNRVILYTWVGCGGLAALGGVLFGISDTISWDMGFTLLLLMFAAVVLGGLGTAYGPMVGAIIIGVASQVSTYWISTKYRIAVALAVLIVAVIVRPQGILGRRERIG